MLVNNYTNWEQKPIEQTTDPHKHLIVSCSILDDFKVKYYLGFGTALGFYRDKDFIKQDSDLDLEIITTPDTPTEEIVNVFKMRYTYIRSVYEDGEVQQAAFITSDGLIIDLSFFRLAGDEYVTKHEEGKYIDRVDVIGNTQLIETKYGQFPFPDKMDEYLTARYGDWRTPKYGALTSSIRV